MQSSIFGSTSFREKDNYSKKNSCKRRETRRSDEGCNMIEFVKENHVDLRQILENTDSALISPDMQLLWEQQTKQLYAKSCKGFRWKCKVYTTSIFLNSVRPISFCKYYILDDGIRNLNTYYYILLYNMYFYMYFY